MLVFVLLNQHADNFHERSERVRLVFSDFIDQAVEQRNQSLILGFGMGDEYGVSQRRPRIYPFCSRRNSAPVTPSTFLHSHIPMSQGRFGLGKFLSKFIEPFPNTYMHVAMIVGAVLGQNTPALPFQPMLPLYGRAPAGLKRLTLIWSPRMRAWAAS